MALNACIACLHVIHSRGIQDIPARRMLRVLASRTVTFFAAYVPLCHLLGVNVVVYRVAAIASRSRRPLHIVWWIEWHPPVCAVSRKIGTPDLLGHIPLRWLGKVVVPTLVKYRCFQMLP